MSYIQIEHWRFRHIRNNLFSSVPLNTWWYFNRCQMLLRSFRTVLRWSEYQNDSEIVIVLVNQWLKCIWKMWNVTKDLAVFTFSCVHLKLEISFLEIHFRRILFFTADFLIFSIHIHCKSMRTHIFLKPLDVSHTHSSAQSAGDSCVLAFNIIRLV